MSRLLPCLLVLMLLGSLLCSGCRTRSAPTAPAPLVPSALLGSPSTRGEAAAGSMDGELPKIREAVREYMKEVAPGNSVEGVWVLMFRSNYCLAGADMKVGPQRRTVDLLVRLYARENGSEYWRAESLDRGFVTLLSQPGRPAGPPAE